jgi:hypothetical protein
MGDLPTHVYPGLFSGATGPHTHTVYFHGRPASYSHWFIFTANLPTHVHPGLFSGMTGPHTHTVYFHGGFFSFFFLMIRLVNLVLPDCRVDLKTPHDDKVDFLVSLRFS